MTDFSADFSDNSDFRLVNNCFKMTAYDVTGIAINQKRLSYLLKMINNLLLIVCLACLYFNYSLIRQKSVFTVRKMKNFPETMERE